MQIRLPRTPERLEKRLSGHAGRIDELKRRIERLERRKEAEEVMGTECFRRLRRCRANLHKAIAAFEELGARLHPTFVAATKQYSRWLEQVVDELAGKRRR